MKYFIFALILAFHGVAGIAATAVIEDKVVVVNKAVSADVSMTNDKLLRVRVGEYQPFAFRDVAGQWQGMDIDFANALAKEAGYKTQFEEKSWARGLKFIMDGKLDIVAGVTKTKAREKYLIFIGVSYEEQNIILVKDDLKDLKIDSHKDFTRDGYRFGLRFGLLYEDKFNNLIKNDQSFASHIDFQSDPWLNIKKLKYNRITGFICDINAALYSIKSDPEFAGLNIVKTPVFPAIPVYFAMSRKIPKEKVQRVSRAYKRLKQQGVFQAIVQKWTR